MEDKVDSLEKKGDGVSSLQMSARLVRIETELNRLIKSTGALSQAPVVSAAVPGGSGNVSAPPMVAPSAPTSAASAPCASAPSVPIPLAAPASAPASVPASVPAPAPAPASSKPSFIEVLRRGKPKPITKAMIEAAPDPLELLIAKPDSTRGKTTKISSMVLSTSLARAAKVHPYLTWRTICAKATGNSPLNIVPITPDQVEVFWDVSSETSLATILAGLAKKGVRVDQSPPTEAARGRRLRAYLSSYFVLLRQAALEGLDDASKAWILTSASRRVNGTGDKDAIRVWRRRIAHDTRDYNLTGLMASAEQPAVRKRKDGSRAVDDEIGVTSAAHDSHRSTDDVGAGPMDSLDDEMYSEAEDPHDEEDEEDDAVEDMDAGPNGMDFVGDI